MPDGWDPATTPIATFIGCLLLIDVDGRELSLTVMGEKAEIEETFSGTILWKGEAPSGPFGIEGASFIIEKLRESK